MKITYDKNADALYIKFKEEDIDESDEHSSGAILDYAKDGTLVGIEILNASTKVSNPDIVDFEKL